MKIFIRKILILTFAIIMVASVLPAYYVSAAGGDTWINNPGAPKTPEEAESQTKAVYANINGLKTVGGNDMPLTTKRGSGADDLVEYQFNHESYGHCNILTLRQLCYLDIVKFDKKTAITPSAANGWRGVEPDFSSNHKKGAGGVLGAGLWTGGGNYCDGTDVIGDYTTYGITVQDGYEEKGRINIDEIGIKRVTGSGEYGPANYRKKTAPLFESVNRKLWDYLNTLPDPCYNIVLEYGPAKSNEVIFGHSMFLNAVMSDSTGTKYVYYNESYSSYSNGYRPENLIKEKLTDFYNRYKFKTNNPERPTRLWYGGMYFEKKENNIQFKVIKVTDNTVKKQPDSGLFVLTADYTYQGKTKRVIMNLRGENSRYSVFQWAAHEEYNPDKHEIYANLTAANGADIIMYAIPAPPNDSEPVIIDYSTLKRNTSPGYKDLFDRYSNFNIVLVKPPDGYNNTPAKSELIDDVWVIEIEPLTAKPLDSSVFINGEAAEFCAYDIQGSSYFKLRDLAYALNGTKKQFNVTWDFLNQVSKVTKNQGYAAVGGEMAVKGTEIKSAKAEKTLIYIDSKPVSFDIYVIDNVIYYKLNDIAEFLELDIRYDRGKNAYVIDTTG